jgi:hypothetical protein
MQIYGNENDNAKFVKEKLSPTCKATKFTLRTPIEFAIFCLQPFSRPVTLYSTVRWAE